MTKLAIFSVGIRVTQRGDGAPKIRGLLEMRVGDQGARGAYDPAAIARQMMGAASQATIEQMARELGRAPAAPPAMPHSRREVLEQRDGAQRGMQQNLRNALALDTIEAFYDDAGDGKIQRLAGTGDPEASACAACGIRTALPMASGDAAFVRAAFRKARMPQAMGYAFATTRVIVTQKNRHRLCGCDVAAWDRAIAFFKVHGRATWQRFGLDP